MEWGSRLLVVFLKVEKALLELGQRGEIIRSEHFPLDDGEINLDLIEPAGMNWGVHEDGIGPTGSDAFNRPGRDEPSSCP